MATPSRGFCRFLTRGADGNYLKLWKRSIWSMNEKPDVTPTMPTHYVQPAIG